MDLKNSVCTTCGCLCDEIEIQIEENRITRVENACGRGTAFIYATDNLERRTPSLVRGRQVSPQEAIEEAAQLLRQARHPLIFGLDNSTLEAQAVAIRLAKGLKAVIDDVSSFCHGTVNELIINGSLPTCSFSEVKDTDLLIYWGSNCQHSHPRHLSHCSYYSHERYLEAGWFPDVTLSSVEVRETETTSLCKPAFRLSPGGDRDFISAILDTLSGKGESKQAKDFVGLIKKSHFCTVFVGLGLVYALDDDFSQFRQMMKALSEWSRLAVIPMLGHSNMQGFNHSLYKETGHVNKVSFANGVRWGREFSFLEQVRNRASDCVLIIGSDPVVNLPHSLVQNLRGIPIICLDPFINTTTSAAQVVIGVAVSGIETGGKVIRMDGEEMSLQPVKTAESPSDEEALSQLLERVVR